MQDDIFEFIKKHNGNVCILHVAEEFDYISKVEISRSIKLLIFSGRIVTLNGGMSYNGKEYKFLKVNTDAARNN